MRGCLLCGSLIKREVGQDRVEYGLQERQRLLWIEFPGEKVLVCLAENMLDVLEEFSVLWYRHGRVVGLMYAWEKKWGGIRYWSEVGTVYYLVKETG